MSGSIRPVLRIFLIAALLAPGWALPQSDFRPVDEAASVPDFFSFRARLQAAVARHDVPAVLSVLHRDIKLSFGGEHGIDDFKTLWQPESAASPLWETLASILALGGTFTADQSFTAPYVFSSWPSDLDAFDFVAVVASGVRVRAGPSLVADVIDSLSFTTVELAAPPTLDTGWFKVKLRGGREGYVDSRYVRSPLDYRVNFSKIDGRWQATYFLQGD